jgi:D-alanine-D-alanine ligase-like ATP-grasp enzyme
MKLLKLSFGALDFIVDKDEDWWFLEVNTAGCGLRIYRVLKSLIG